MMNITVFRARTKDAGLSCLALIVGLGLAIRAEADTHYVATNGTHATPYTNWVDAATNIQAAIDVSIVGDMVLVGAGVYDTGAMIPPFSYGGNAMTSPARVVINKAITVRSASGDPDTTIIKGAWDPVTTNGSGAIHGVYLTANSWLVGITVTNGATFTNSSTGCFFDTSGGGVVNYNGNVSNCVIVGNAAHETGGGACFGTYYDCRIDGNFQLGSGASAGGGGMNSGTTLHRCTFIGNFSNGSLGGGGAYGATHYNGLFIGNHGRVRAGGATSATLHNCTVTRNYSPGRAGGVTYCTLNNCIVQDNNAVLAGTENWDYMSAAYTVTNSCISPTNTLTGSGNITNTPMFLNVGTGYGLSLVPGNYRLNNDSPCINAGMNRDWMIGTVDLDGHQRIDRYYGGIVDMGAYEFGPRGTIFIGH